MRISAPLLSDVNTRQGRAAGLRLKSVGTSPFLPPRPTPSRKMKRGVDRSTPHGTHVLKLEDYTSPWSSMALATFKKPPMLAPFTRLPGVP